MSIPPCSPTALAHFHHRFPRTYPTNAHPIFTVQQPIKGIPDDCVAKLSNFIQAEARQSRGTELVFQVSKHLIIKW
jgi:translation initiation factor 2-alpha kinase 4